jgi:alpha-D-ribose 1-methylphosphonate 5-triphosphate synthase subunit PhnL
LERYAEKQQQTAEDIQCTLQVNTQELAKCCNKLKIAELLWKLSPQTWSYQEKV